MSACHADRQAVLLRLGRAVSGWREVRQAAEAAHYSVYRQECRRRLPDYEREVLEAAAALCDLPDCSD